MKLTITEQEKTRIKSLYILNEQTRDPKNPDSHPDLDEWGSDSYWKFSDWKTWFNSNVSKYGVEKSKVKFFKFWEPVSEGTMVASDDDLDIEWCKSNGLWNNSTNKIYTTSEYTIAKQGQYKNKLDKKYEVSLPLKPSQNLKQFLKCEEGSPKQKCQPVLTAYRIPGEDYDTIGFGHNGEDVNRQYRKITHSKAEELLDNDINEAADCVNRMLSRWKQNGLKTYKLTQGQFDACVSFVFNAGCTSFLNSDFVQQTKVGNHKKAAELIKTENVLMAGHTGRRERESSMYLGEKY